MSHDNVLAREALLFPLRGSMSTVRSRALVLVVLATMTNWPSLEHVREPVPRCWT